MKRNIALGMALGSSGNAIEVPEDDMSQGETIETLKQKVDELTKAFQVLNSKLNDRRDDMEMGIPFVDTKENIPVGTTLVSHSQRGGLRFLTVTADGYYVGITKYDSLSAAAEAVSGVRRSGWTFWKLADGRTAKEAYKD